MNLAAPTKADGDVMSEPWGTTVEDLEAWMFAPAAKQQEDEARREAVERSRREAEAERAKRRAEKKRKANERAAAEQAARDAEEEARAAKRRAAEQARARAGEPPRTPDHKRARPASPPWSCPPRTSEFARPRCGLCGGALQVIGRARANGKQSHDDWASRQYHKKCWRKMMEEKEQREPWSPPRPRKDCTNCGSRCQVKTSHTAKNPDRDYYSCPSCTYPDSFVGWVDED